MKKNKLYLITLGKAPYPIHKMVIQFKRYKIIDHKRYFQYNIIAHTTDKGISLMGTVLSEPKNINTSEPVHKKDLPLYVGWALSPLFDKLLKKQN